MLGLGPAPYYGHPLTWSRNHVMPKRHRSLRTLVGRVGWIVPIGVALASDAAAAPIVGPEYELDAPILTEQELLPRTMLRAAFNGTTHLALFAADGALRARRIGVDGTVIDGTDIVLDTNWTGSYNILSAIPDGDDFLVLWYTPQGGKLGRIDSAGDLVSVAPCNVQGEDAQLIRGGAGILVSTASGLMLIDESGATVVPLTRPIADPACINPSVDYLNGVYLYACKVTGSVTDSIRSIRVGENLQPLDPSPTVVTQGSVIGLPTVLAAGSEFLLRYKTTARRVATTGTLSAPYPFPEARQVAYASGVYHVINWDLAPASYRRYGSDLVAIDAAPTVISDLQVYAVAMNAGPTGAVVAMLENDGNVRASALDTTPTVTEKDALVSSNLSFKANAQTHLVAATNDDGISLLLWSDSRTSPRGTYGMRLGPTGDPIDAAPFYVDAGYPDIQLASNGDSFVMSYARTGPPCGVCLYTRRIGADGTIGAETASFKGSYAISGRPLASDGAGYGFVLRNQYGPAGDFPYPLGGVSDENGVPVATMESLPLAGDGNAGFDIAFDGVQYLVAYSSFSALAFDTPVLRTARMSTAGVVDDVALDVDTGRSPAIAHRNGTTLLVYNKSEDVSLGARLDANNQLVDFPSFQVAAGGVTGLYPTSAGFLLGRATMSSDRGIEAIVLDDDGQPLESFTVTDEAGDEYESTFLNGGSFVAYVRFDPTSDIEATRVRVRKLLNEPQLQPLGTACAVADECESAFCVDGVCCESGCNNGSCDDSGTCVPSSSGDGGGGGSASSSGGGDSDGGGDAGGASAGGAPSSGGATNDGDDDGGGSGCSCSVSPDGGSSIGSLAGLLAVAALGRVRTRRREAVQRSRR